MKEPIIVKARLNDEKKIEGSISDIYSKLIQECGRWTECYNSDILYDFDLVKKLLDYGNWKDYKYHSVEESGDEVCLLKFGFRQYGVDGLDFINCREKREYRALWTLEIRKMKNPEYYWETVQFKLWREF